MKGDKKEKLAIYKSYDFAKGGTDIVGHMNDYYTNRAKTLRWDTLVFYYMLDTIRLYVVVSEVAITWSRLAGMKFLPVQLR